MDDTVTLEFKGEGHTLGNLLRHELLLRDDVIFAAYKVPHPLFNEMLISFQTIDLSDESDDSIESIESLTSSSSISSLDSIDSKKSIESSSTKESSGVIESAIETLLDRVMDYSDKFQEALDNL